MTHYAAATLEEVWYRGRLAERRLSHGEARRDERGIVASDTRDDALVAACEAAIGEARAACVAPQVRIVAEATADGVSTLVVVREGRLSVVTTPGDFADDYALLRSIAEEPVETPVEAEGGEPVHPHGAPIVWRNGSAAVLLHEAYGHPLEPSPWLSAPVGSRAEYTSGLQPAAPPEWPEWLTVDVPLRERRASFRDVPLVRMDHVRATQHEAPFALPERRIEVLLVDGGAWEPLTETVTLHVAAAALVDGARTRRIPPFTLRETRAAIARSLRGATGEPLRYPGVICSREGQELFVASYAPVMLTELA